MKAIELIQFSAKALKALTKLGIRADDVQYINLWFDYHKLVAESGKKTYAEEVIAEEYGISTRSVKRIIKRFEAEVMT